MDAAEWWQVLLLFIGIPSALFVIITALVLWLSEARTPDGLAGADKCGDGAAPARTAKGRDRTPDETG